MAPRSVSAVVEYQFPSDATEGKTDRNWLIIAGGVRTPDLNWKFRDTRASLSMSSHSFRDWLKQIEGGAPVNTKYFTEPNLEFGFDQQAQELVVHFASKLLLRRSCRRNSLRRVEHRFKFTHTAIADAIQAIERTLQSFPAL